MRRPTICIAIATLVFSTGGTESEQFETITKELVLSVVDDVVAEVQRLRGLKFKQPVPVELIDDDAAREHMMRRLERFDMDERLPHVQRAYELLGLLPPGTDILETYLEALREQAGGFYDPASRSYYLLDDMPAVLAPSITAHELTHALEDQYFKLDRQLRAALRNDDRVFALGAVHEGSAMLVMMQFVTAQAMRGDLDPAALQAVTESQAAQAEALEAMPPVLLRQLMGPYVLGSAFLLRGDLFSIADGYPANDVDAVYEDTPLSSEQILHPEKYWGPDDRDDPTRVDLEGVGRVLGSGWSREFEGVLGELTLAVMTGAGMPLELQNPLASKAEDWTNQAASGWDGDCWELWTHRDAAVVLLGTVWDTPQDAQEFSESLVEREGFGWKVQDDRVAIVAGSVSRKKTAKLLSRILASR